MAQVTRPSGTGHVAVWPLDGKSHDGVWTVVVTNIGAVSVDLVSDASTAVGSGFPLAVNASTPALLLDGTEELFFVPASATGTVAVLAVRAGD